ncbi:MAG: YhdP family protein [Gammaproteobacteria bacterium]|nr:YhdP family protein [Gammaproteobacteria bacterium]
MGEVQNKEEQVDGDKPVQRPATWQKILGLISRCCFVLLILATFLLTTSRLLMPLMRGQQAAIEQQLAEALGTDVSIGSLEGDWFRLGPIVAISNLEIPNPASPDSSHIIPNLRIRPAFLSSLLSGKLIIDQVIVTAPELALVQNPDGNWSLEGLAGGGNNTDAIIDILLNTKRLQLVEARLDLRWSDGRELNLENIYIDLGNSDSKHQANIQARIAGQPSPFLLHLEITGDPRNRFSGSAYLQTTELEISDLISTDALVFDSAKISSDMWVTFQEGLLYSVQAEVQALTLEGEGSEDSSLNALALQNASMGLTLSHDSPDQWQVWLDDVQFDWQSRPWDFSSLYLDYRQEDELRPLDIQANSIELAMAYDIVDDLLVLPQGAVDALNDLTPSGALTNLHVKTELNGNYEDGFLLQGNLDNVAVGAWQGAPAAQGIQGYVQASASKGLVELDSRDFEIHLPQLFTDSWQFDSASSRVHWRLQDDIIHVNSSVIDVSNESIHGHVQFDLYNHRDSTGQMQSELTLLIGVLELDVAYKSFLLPNMENIQSTLDWVEETLLSGFITNSGFVSRTSTRSDAPLNSGTVMSFYHIEDGDLKFQPEWPVLEEIKAFVKVDNNEVDVSAESGLIEEILLENTEATVRPGAQGGTWLSVGGSAETSTDLGLAFLRNTPVRDDIGDFIDEWQGEGNIQVDIQLRIPLNNPQQSTDVLVNVFSNTSKLTIPEYSLSVEELRGNIVYGSESGLSASALSGMLFDFPIAATIEPLVEEGNTEGGIFGTRIVGSGRASKSALQAWEGQPEFVRDVMNFASGEIDYLAEISIPYADQAREEMAGTSLRLTSELLGLSFDLPHPFNKTVNNIRPLELHIEFSDDEQWVSARFDNRVGANILITGDDFTGGRILLGPDVRLMEFGPRELEGNGLYFEGFQDRANFENWETASERFSDMAMNPDEGRGLEDFISLFDVRIGLLEVAGQEIENAQTQVFRIGGLANDSETGDAPADSWQVTLENEVMSGDFIFPDAENTPWDINLKYLRFPEDEDEEEIPGEESEEVDIFADVIPGELPDMDFHTDEFIIGDKNLGAWDFVLRTNGESASISDLRMTAADARITDNSRQSGANLSWGYNEGMHTSSFTGLFSAGDLAILLPSWGYDTNVESQSAEFISNLQWNGSPAAFDMDKIIGNIQLDIRDGRFVDVDSGSSRLFGAFTFDSLVRRLQLDFSDLYESGFAYDTIQGRLDFDNGIVSNNGDFVIAGPSSRIMIDGEIDLNNETIDADMLVNVPLSQNLSVLAGILGAWPIAVSTFIASRLFRNQMDDFTTVVYRLEGPWDNPDSRFEPSDEILEVEINTEEQEPAIGVDGLESAADVNSAGNP